MRRWPLLAISGLLALELNVRDLEYDVLDEDPFVLAGRVTHPLLKGSLASLADTIRQTMRHRRA